MRDPNLAALTLDCTTITAKQLRASMVNNSSILVDAPSPNLAALTLDYATITAKQPRAAVVRTAHPFEQCSCNSIQDAPGSGTLAASENVLTPRPRLT